MLTKQTMAFLVILISVLVSYFAQASDEPITGRHALMSPEEIEIKTKAKKRLYPGGQDEESLKVQAQLPAVTRKMSPVTDNPAEDSSEPSEEY